MPVTFDFNNDAGIVSSFTSSYNLTNVADGVRFTASDNDLAGITYTYFGNGAFPNTPLLFSATVPQVFTLSLQATASAALTQFSGTGANPIVLNLGAAGGPSTPFAGVWNVTFVNETGNIVQQFANVTANQNLSATGQVAAIKFSTSSSSGSMLTVESLTVNSLNCFCAGTMIATPQGETPVDALRAGDRVLTADGRETIVAWLGVQKVDTRLMHPRKVNPIRISAGALGEGLPVRDLYLSQDHAIEIDGTLYNAGTLVNGTTIRQVMEMPLDGFAYYHVETGGHDLLLAEGVAAESFIDYIGRDDFENAADAPARTIAEMDLPRVSSARMVPHALRNRLAALAVPEPAAA